MIIESGAKKRKFSIACQAHPDTTAKTGGYANRNAGFIRQPGEPNWGCRMNPAFRWWCQAASRACD
jgi:hypothetical protein